jgi:hypothetical protein
VVLGQVLGALAGGHDLEAAAARPVDHFHRQRGLIAVGHRVNDACLFCLSREVRAGQYIGLDVDHDDVFAVFAAKQCMPYSSRGVPGGFDHDVDLIAANQLFGIVDKIAGGDARLIPADLAAIGLCARRIQVGDGLDRKPGSKG